MITPHFCAQRVLLVVLLAAVVPLAGCYPPAQPAPASVSVADEPVATGGVALTYHAQGADNTLLRPATRVLASSSWDVVSSSQEWSELLGQNGCIEMALIESDEPPKTVALSYAPAAIGGVITPTVWSEYTDLVAPTERDPGQIDTASFAISPSFVISDVRAVESAAACGSRTVEDDFDAWSAVEGLEIVEFDRLMLTVPQADGSIERILIVVEPTEGAGCDYVHSACSNCKGCGYGFICSVATRLICSNR